MRNAGRIRLLLGLLAVAAVIALVYGSFVPMHFRPRPWSEAMAAFREIPWLELGVYKRDDWIANGLVVIPAGWLAAGAVDWGRRSRVPLIVAVPVIMLALSALVIAIEFAQVWFRPRTQSTNDIVAGLAGAVAGPLLWAAAGRPMIRAVINLREAELTWQRVRWGLWVYVVLNLLYAVMPLDLVVSFDELAAKAGRGYLVLWPSADLELNQKAFMSWFLAACRTSVVAFIIAIERGPKAGLIAGVGFGALCEVVQIPVFSRAASSLDVLAGAVGAAVGAAASTVRGYALAALKHAWVWLAAVAAGLVAILAALLFQAERLVTDPAELAGRWEDLWAWPFAKAYWNSEFGAATNLLAKLSVFAIVGFLLHGGIALLKRPTRMIVAAVGWAAILLVCVAVEIGQVYLAPSHPDATDVLCYASGAVLGYGGYAYLNPRRMVISS